MSDKSRGRPKTDRSSIVKRSWQMPKALYERLQEIAAVEKRDTTGQVVKVLQDFVDKYDKGEGRGNIVPMLYANELAHTA